MAFKIVKKKVLSTNPMNIEGPILIIGAAHTGKSEFAHSLLDHSAKATIIGTADSSEPAFRPRLNELKSLRSKNWDSIDDPDDIFSLMKGSEKNQLLVDSLNQWVARQITDRSSKYSYDQLEQIVDKEGDRLVDLIKNYENPNQLFIVTSEVGAGVTPPPALARLFRQSAGKINTKVASVCKTVIMLSAGIPIVIKGKPLASFPSLTFRS